MMEDAFRNKPKAYTTVKQEAQIEFEEKKSRFIGICLPVRDSAEAEARLERCRRDYPDATHHVYAWQTVLPERGGRYSDDGEPQGTAGMPVLDVLRKRGVDQAQILVVRYFGGTLLGAGGLVRAYSKAAALALEAAEPLPMALRRRFHIVCPYDCYDKLRYQLDKAGFYQETANFGMDAEWTAACAPGSEEQLAEILAANSAGAALMEEVGMDYAPAE